VIGFDDDERDYGIAARMLQMLGCPPESLDEQQPHQA
jgi:GTP cyclohydrolase II